MTSNRSLGCYGEVQTSLHTLPITLRKSWQFNVKPQVIVFRVLMVSIKFFKVIRVKLTQGTSRGTCRWTTSFYVPVLLMSSFFYNVLVDFYGIYLSCNFVFVIFFFYNTYFILEFR